MAFDLSNLDFNGEEVKTLGEAVQETVFTNPEATLFHEFVEGIKAEKQIAILGKIEGLTGKGDGSCKPTEDTLNIGTSQKKWLPKVVSNRFPFCWTETKDSFFIYGTKNGIDKADLTSTDYLNFIIDRLTPALKEEVSRIVWFSDVDAADVNASPPGVLTAGTDASYFNKIDGLWKQLFAIAAADANRLTAGLGTRNAGASFAAQEFTPTDTTNRVVTNTLQNMRYGADMRLRGKTDLQYVVTQSVYDQYERELTEANVAFTTDRLENGMAVLKSGSITVVAFDFWDRIIRAYESDGTKYNLPHRAVLLTKENTQVGTESIGTLSEIDAFYDKKDKTNYVDTAYSIDAKIIEDYLVQVAY